MVRIAKKSDPRRLRELKQKIRDRQYVQEAIRKIAEQLSDELANNR